jgi:hypothetical protein
MDPRDEGGAVRHGRRGQAFDVPHLTLARLKAREAVGPRLPDGCPLDVGRRDDSDRELEDPDPRLLRAAA